MSETITIYLKGVKSENEGTYEIREEQLRPIEKEIQSTRETDCYYVSCKTATSSYQESFMFLKGNRKTLMDNIMRDFPMALICGNELGKLVHQIEEDEEIAILFPLFPPLHPWSRNNESFKAIRTYMASVMKEFYSIEDESFYEISINQ